MRSPLLLILLFTTAAPAAQVRLHATAAAGGPVIRLGDVADIDGTPAERTALLALRLAPAPLGTGRVRLDAVTIRTRVAAAGFPVTVSGAGSVLVGGGVSRPAGRRDSRRDRQRAERYVVAVAAAHLKRLTADGDTLGVRVELPDDAVRTLAAQRPVGGDLAGFSLRPGVAQPVSVRWVDRSGEVRSVPATVTLSPRPLVPVVARAVRKGGVITAAHVELRPAPPSSAGPSSTAPVPTPDALVGSQAARSLSPGRPFRPRDTEPVPLVRANQTVAVRSTFGGVSVSRTMRALRDGAAGETIPLMTLETRERVYARVNGNRRAVIVAGAEQDAAPPYAVAGENR